MTVWGIWQMRTSRMTVRTLSGWTLRRSALAPPPPSLPDGSPLAAPGSPPPPAPTAELALRIDRVRTSQAAPASCVVEPVTVGQVSGADDSDKRVASRAEHVDGQGAAPCFGSRGESTEDRPRDPIRCAEMSGPGTLLADSVPGGQPPSDQSKGVDLRNREPQGPGYHRIPPGAAVVPGLNNIMVINGPHVGEEWAWCLPHKQRRRWGAQVDVS